MPWGQMSEVLEIVFILVRLYFQFVLLRGFMQLHQSRRGIHPRDSFFLSLSQGRVRYTPILCPASLLHALLSSATTGEVAGVMLCVIQPDLGLVGL